MGDKKLQINQEDIMKLLDKLYDNSIHGISKVSPPISQLADDYLQKSKDTEIAAKSFINYQIAKCTTSGFVTGLGGAHHITHRSPGQYQQRSVYTNADDRLPRIYGRI